MSTCLARQPIFDNKLNIYGYELLYRSDEHSREYDGTNPDRSSSETIVLSMDIGTRRLTGNSMAFINFTEKLLLDEVATILPKNHLVIEILEDIKPDEEILEACKRLKRQGYLLALDDFELSEENKVLLSLADIIKIDFMRSSSHGGVKKEMDGISRALHEMRRSGVRYLAEKVETREDYAAAKKMGFSYYQGYFFSKPEICSAKHVTPSYINEIKLIRMIANPMADYRKLAATISNDPVLTYRVLRLVNSAYYDLKYEVKSVSHALAILGINNIRKYVTLLTIQQLTNEKPEELFRISLVRAHFLESLAPLAGMRKAKNTLFMLGLFSLMDVIVGLPMEEVVELTQLSESISVPLLKHEGKSADLLKVAENYERGNWDVATEIACQYGISEREMLKLYLDAIEWADDMF